MILGINGIIAGKGTSSSLLTNLYAVYKAESNANDSLGVYNGTANGGLTYTIGISGNAFTGNGTNAFVSMANNSFNFTGDYSVSLWMNLTNTGGNQDLFSNADIVSGVDRGYRVQFRGLTNNIRVSIYGASAITLDTGNIISTNTWYNVVVTRKASTRTRIYINGNLSTSNTSIINPNYTGTFTPCIGAYKSVTIPSTLNYLTNGSKIDEVALWNKELTSTEVTELYNSGSGKFYPY